MKRKPDFVLRRRRKRNFFVVFLKFLLALLIWMAAGVLSPLVFFAMGKDITHEVLEPIPYVTGVLFGFVTFYKFCFGGFISKYDFPDYLRGENVVNEISNGAYVIILAVYIVLQILVVVLDQII